MNIKKVVMMSLLCFFTLSSISFSFAEGKPEEKKEEKRDEEYEKYKEENKEKVLKENKEKKDKNKEEFKNKINKKKEEVMKGMIVVDNEIELLEKNKEEMKTEIEKINKMLKESNFKEINFDNYYESLLEEKKWEKRSLENKLEYYKKVEKGEIKVSKKLYINGRLVRSYSNFDTDIEKEFEEINQMFDNLIDRYSFI